MERTRSLPPATSPRSVQWTTGERPRAKLQKGASRQRASFSSKMSPSSPRHQPPDDRARPKSWLDESPGLGEMSDSKWLEYVARGGPASPASATSPDLPPAVPELSYLRSARSTPRHSLDSLSAYSTPPSAMLNASAARRRAKTPVFSVGQLERASLVKKALNVNRMSSVERIAEQYRALLELNDDPSSSPRSGPRHRSPPLSLQRAFGDDREGASPRSRKSLLDRPLPPRSSHPPLVHGPPVSHSHPQLHTCPYFHSRSHSNPASGPPSDDDTVVAFEDDAAYIKPASPSLGPPPPLRVLVESPDLEFEEEDTMSSTTPNLGLQICLDLLTRELSSATAQRSAETGSEMSALQIWAMIEAYEKLRDTVSEMAETNETLRGTEAIFDTWVQALYSLHDLIVRDSRGIAL